MFLSGKILSLCTLGLALTSCGKAPSSSTHASEELAPVTGELAPTVAKFKASKYLSTCDTKNLPQMKEIAAAVDQHQDEVASYLKQELEHPHSKTYKEVQVGPMLVRELLVDKKPKEGWQNTDSSWTRAQVLYARLQADPTAEDWYYLNSEVRSLVSNDERRLLHGATFSIGKDDEPLLTSALKSTQDCVADSGCILPKYEASALTWMQKQYDYASYLSILKKSDTHTDAEPTLEIVEKFLKGDVGRFAMHVNTSVTRSENVLHLPLNTSDFKDVTRQLSQYIESVWTSSGLTLKLDWKTDTHPDFFTFTYDPSSGSRSYVIFDEKQVVLFNATEAKAIAHETGHVLGFRDHYYETWDEAQCAYITWYREDDLMSDHTHAHVLDEEWAILNSTYPAK